MKDFALIIGASNEIGREIARELSSKYNLFLTYNNNYQFVKEMEDELSYKTLVRTFKLDLENDEDIDNLGMELKNRNLSLIVGVAGFSHDKIWNEYERLDLLKYYNINVAGYFMVFKKLINYMKEGSIISINSTNSTYSYYPESLAYDASKAALLNLNHNLALIAKPIRVNTILCGWVDSGEKLSNEEYKKEKEKIILNRFATPKDVSSLVSFLSSDKASYINDAIINLDGGKIR